MTGLLGTGPFSNFRKSWGFDAPYTFLSFIKVLTIESIKIRHIQAYTYRTHTYINTPTHTVTHTHTLTHNYTHTYTYTHIYIHHTYIYIYMYLYIYTQCHT